MTERAGHRAGTTTTASSNALDEARRRIEDLEIDLQTSRRIGVAIGILMSRHGLSEDKAYANLVEVSRAGNRDLRDVANEVVNECGTERRSSVA